MIIFYQQGKIIWKKIFKLNLQVSIALKKRYSKISPCFKKLNLRFRKLILDFARLILDFIFLQQRFGKLFLVFVGREVVFSKLTSRIGKYKTGVRKCKSKSNAHQTKSKHFFSEYSLKKEPPYASRIERFKLTMINKNCFLT